jgi:hypothetical protein
MKHTLLFIITAIVAHSAIAQENLTGYVYDDTNRNGKKDKSEKGIPNVPVSNGIDVVLTDRTGKYSLPVANDNTIFVIKPSGYKPATDEFYIPRFFYTHKPAGSPPLKYKGVEPTGKLPKSVDFALQQYDEPDDFSALIFGDTQTYNETEIDFLTRGIVAEAAANTQGALFGISLGDLVGDNLSLHPSYKKAIAKVGLPWYNLMGNHDRNYDNNNDDLLSDETFQANFGAVNYAFNYGKAHFLVLDDIITTEKSSYTGGLRPDQISFIANDLRHVPADRLIIVALHIPFTDVEPGAFREADRRQFLALLDKYPRILFLSAHTHFQCHSREGKIHEYNVGTTCGDWYSGTRNDQNLPLSIMRDGTPPGYAFLHIKGNDYVLDYKALGHPSDYRMSIYSPKVVRANASTTASIYANIFMASDTDEVEYRIDSSDWAPMRNVKEYDPSYCRYVQDWDYLDNLLPGRRPSNPIICRHLWKAPIPTGLSIGNHRIEIRTKDTFGRIHTQYSTYRISQ